MTMNKWWLTWALIMAGAITLNILVAVTLLKFGEPRAVWFWCSMMELCR